MLRAKADADIDAALEHCLAEAPQRVDGLLTAFESIISSIGNAPRMGSPRYAEALELPGLRCRMTRRFRYLVFYIEGADEISVLRVLHQSRDLPAGFVAE